MENKSREYLQQKEATASSAVVGLTGLGNRLDSLLDRLVKSYSISEEDIEVCKMCLVIPLLFKQIFYFKNMFL